MPISNNKITKMKFAESEEQKNYKKAVDIVLAKNAKNIKMYKEDLEDDYYVEDVDDLTDEEGKHLFFYILCKFFFTFTIKTHPEKIKQFMNPSIKLKYNAKLIS
jgi:hypothetical protein